MEIWFPAYRRHEAARIRASDAVMALLAATRIAVHKLADVGDQSEMLPIAMAEIPDLERMNRNISDSRRVIDEAERQLVIMTIPYVLSVHHAFVADCIEMLEPGRKATGEHLELAAVHADFEALAGTKLPADLIGLFDLLRHLRNRIVHYAAIQGSHLREKWNALPAVAREGWENVAGRSLAISDSSSELDLQMGEMIAGLMIVTRLAREVSGAMVPALSRDEWADSVIADYRDERPGRFAQKATRSRRCRGFAATFYGPLELNETEIEAAIQRYEGDAARA